MLYRVVENVTASGRQLSELRSACNCFFPKSDESGTGRDESGTGRDESAAGWDESAARGDFHSAGMMHYASSGRHLALVLFNARSLAGG